MKFFKKTAVVVLAAAVFYFAGCAPRVILKTPDAAVIEKRITVSPEELAQWRKMASEGADSEERSKGAFWAGQYYLNLKETESAIRYFAHNERNYSDTVWGYVSILRLAEIYLSLIHI